MRLAFGLASVLLATQVQAWQPEKPIESVVGFSPGSGNEIGFRLVAPTVEKNTGAKFTIVNRPGAGSAIANEAVTKEPTDGYHALIASVPALVATDRMVVPAKKHGLNDITPVLAYAGSPMTIIAHPNDPVNTFADFVRTVKSQPVTLGDPGSAARLTYELLAQHIKFSEDSKGVARVEYKGPADTLNDVMAGHVRFGIVPLLTSYQSHKGNRVKIIAVTSANALPDLPGVATTASIYPDLVFSLHWGVVLPPSTDRAIVDWYATEFGRVLNTKEVRDALAANQMFVNPALLNPAGFRTFLEREEKKFAPLVDKVLRTQVK